MPVILFDNAVCNFAKGLWTMAHALAFWTCFCPIWPQVPRLLGGEIRIQRVAFRVDVFLCLPGGGGKYILGFSKLTSPMPDWVFSNSPEKHVFIYIP